MDLWDFSYKRYLPVTELGIAATCSGVPWATTRPPPTPPSGPRSTSQSALAITSRLCSITTTAVSYTHLTLPTN